MLNLTEGWHTDYNVTCHVTIILTVDFELLRPQLTRLPIKPESGKAFVRNQRSHPIFQLLLPFRWNRRRDFCFLLAIPWSVIGTRQDDRDTKYVPQKILFALDFPSANLFFLGLFVMIWRVLSGLWSHMCRATHSTALLGTGFAQNLVERSSVGFLLYFSEQLCVRMSNTHRGSLFEISLCISQGWKMRRVDVKHSGRTWIRQLWLFRSPWDPNSGLLVYWVLKMT